MKAEVESILAGLEGDVDTMTAQDLLNRIGPPAVRLEQVVQKAA